MRSELNYAGKNLSEFGMWFDNSKVYKKPSKRFMGYDIPARNGTLYQSENKFNNVIIEFDCFIKDNFDQNYNDLVNFLNSFETYQKLVNSYNGNMYRMALFHEAIEVDTGQFLKDGRFKLFFDCKPQEYYADGAEFEHIASHYDTYTGDPAVLENEGDSAVTNLKVALEPIQTGSGDPSPTNIRPISGQSTVTVEVTGKNMLPTGTFAISGGGTTTATFGSDGIHIYGTKAQAQWADYLVTHEPITLKANTSYTFSLQVSNTSVAWSATLRNGNTQLYEVIANNGSGTLTITPTADVTFDRWRLTIRSNDALTVNSVAKLMLRLSSTTSTYEPYTNTSYTTNLGRTVYGGTVDLATGVLTVDKGIATFDGSSDENWIEQSGRRCTIVDALPNVKRITGNDRTIGAISNEFLEYTPNQTWTTNIGFSIENSGLLDVRLYTTNTMTVADFKTFLQSNPMQICYPLQTSQTVQLTPQQISLLTGTNIISSSGEVTITTKTPLTLKNPSPMTAKPTFKFTNISAPFTVSANGETIISFQNAITLIKYAIANNMTFNANGTTLTVTKNGTPSYTETSILINSGYLPAGRYSFSSASLGSLEVRSADGTQTFSSGGTFTLTDITQVKIWYVITPSASTPQTFNMPIHLRPLGDLYVNSEMMDCYLIDGNTAYTFNECVELPKDFLELGDRTVITMTSGATGFIAPNWWRL